MTIFRVLASAAFCAVLIACASDPADEYVEKPVHVLYNEAVNALEAQNYEFAAKQFDEVERQHPYSVWATRAQIMSAYSNYQSNKYDDAIITLNRFIQLHPGNRDIAYAYYLKAICYYEQISDVTRDQLATDQALKALREIVRRFPESAYARDVRLKIDLTRDHLAGKEMTVGRYYLRRAEYLAAINRFRNVIDNYQTTSHVPEALHRIAEAYSVLGMKEEAQKAAAVLGHNYPGSEWYVDSYSLITGKDLHKDGPNRKGILARAWDWIF